MKILHFNGYLSGGGVEQYLAQLFPALQAHDIENALVYGEPDEGISRFDGVALHHIEGITRICRDDPRANLSRVKEIIDREKPDLAYLHQVAHLPLVRLVSSLLPTVRFVHDFKLVCPDGRKILKTRGTACEWPVGFRCQLNAYRYRCMPRNPFIGIPLIQNCVGMAALHQAKGRLVVASRFMKAVLIGNGLPAGRIAVIPYFTPLPTLEANRADGGPCRILAVGRITREKGFDYLLRAYAGIPHKALLTIVGDGPELPALKRLAEALGISSRVAFPGWLTREKLDTAYRQCFLAAVPSIWPEPFGIVGIEAMAYQKPVVAFDVGGISQWLQDGETGLLATPRDAQDLREKMDLLLEKPSLAAEMGRRGRAVAEDQFTCRNHCRSLLQLFREAVSHHDIQSIPKLVPL